MNMLFRNPHHRTLFGIWIGWMLVILAFHIFLPARFIIQPPDRALEWTVAETMPGSQLGKLYLNEPFLNRHVSWDSEYYLAIAIDGYEDRHIGRIGAEGGPGTSKSYGFLPFYPVMMRLFSIPLSVLGFNAIATNALAGVILSMLGTLAAMIALYEFAKVEMDDVSGIRAAFYLLIFPSGFFLAEVYTEGLFVGLAFSSLLLLRRRHYHWAALLAVLATLTRPLGIALVIPLVLSWIREGMAVDPDVKRRRFYGGVRWPMVRNGLIAVAPIMAFGLWRMSYYGSAFTRVEEEFFGRRILSLGNTVTAWSDAFRALRDSESNPQAAAYFLVEWLSLVIGFTACIAGFKKHPDLAIFGFLVVFLSFTSGPVQGTYRYVLAAPPVFLFLSRLGSNPIFDRLWTMASILVMSTMCAMFMFDMWAG